MILGDLDVIGCGLDVIGIPHLRSQWCSSNDWAVVSLGWHWALFADHVAARFRVKAALPLVQPLRQHMEMRPNHWPHPAVLPGIPSENS